MSMILSWALFPLVLAAVGLGWGALVEWAGGGRELGALAMPLGLAFKRFPAPTIALAAVSIATTVTATITHPLIGYENEAVTWMRVSATGLA